MKSREFYKLFRELLPPVLSPHGFTRTDSRKATFHRMTDHEVCHVIVPWLVGRGGQWFDIRVLATSPLIDIDFADQFPDKFGMPFDRSTSLDPDSGMTESSNSHVFRGNKAEGLLRNFERQAKPAIEKFAIPYLDNIQTLHDLRSAMTETCTLDYGLVQWHTGDTRRAITTLKAVRAEQRILLQEYKLREPVAKTYRASHEASVQFHSARISFIDNFLSKNGEH